MAQASIGHAIKDRENPFFKSTYADLASIWDACREPLTKNGLSVTQLISAGGAVIKVTTILLHATGQFISTELTMKADKETPQALGSAITYARRYSLAAIVGISSDDDDGNTSSGKPVVAKPQKKSDKRKISEEVIKRFTKAKELLGESDFNLVLLENGIDKVEDIDSEKEAVVILDLMAKKLKVKNAK